MNLGLFCSRSRTLHLPLSHSLSPSIQSRLSVAVTTCHKPHCNGAKMHPTSVVVVPTLRSLNAYKRPITRYIATFSNSTEASDLVKQQHLAGVITLICYKIPYVTTVPNKLLDHNERVIQLILNPCVRLTTLSARCWQC